VEDPLAKRPDSKQATETLEEIDGVFDKIADWVSDNPPIVLGVLGVILGLAAILGFAQSWSARSANSASEAVSAIEAGYRDAMGARPQDVVAPEPANPETGKAVRSDYAAQFLAAGEEHDGTRAAVTARILAGVLLEANGDLAGAVDAWSLAAEEAPAGPLRGLAQLRLAEGLERQEAWSAAAEAYGSAGANEAFPGRYLALAQSARSWIRAGDEVKALEVFADLEASDAPDGVVPAHVRAQLEELKARKGSPEAS